MNSTKKFGYLLEDREINFECILRNLKDDKYFKNYFKNKPIDKYYLYRDNWRFKYMRILKNP